MPRKTFLELACILLSIRHLPPLDGAPSSFWCVVGLPELGYNTFSSLVHTIHTLICLPSISQSLILFSSSLLHLSILVKNLLFALPCSFQFVCISLFQSSPFNCNFELVMVFYSFSLAFDFFFSLSC